MGGQRGIKSTWQIISHLPISGESRGKTTVPNDHTWFNIYPQVVVALRIIGSDHPTRGDKVFADQEGFDSYGVYGVWQGC